MPHKPTQNFEGSDMATC